MDVFMSQGVKYLHSYNDVKDVNPDENYDLFCEINKSNDFRRSITLFFTKLYFKHECLRKTKFLINS